MSWYAVKNNQSKRLQRETYTWKRLENPQPEIWFSLVWLGWVGFYGISTFVGYLMPNPFLYKWSVLFQAILFSKSMQFSSIWPIDRTLSDITTPGLSGPGSDGNEGVVHIPQSSSITGTSPSDYLVSYPGHSLRWGVLLLCRGQSVYSTAPPNWARFGLVLWHINHCTLFNAKSIFIH